MAHHKRHRPRLQRAGCFCGGKANKKFHARATRGASFQYGSRGSELRLRERAQEAA
jgi:hypothetical protein